MDVRKKLVELLHKGVRCPGVIDSCNDCPYHSLEKPCDEFGATVDMLIANGVTVQEWISVKDRLPEFTEEEMERYRFLGDTFFPEFNVMILGATQATTLYFNGGSWYDEEFRCYCVTHWQPMPQPPRGA